jgi:addiction module HigA family antidote
MIQTFRRDLAENLFYDRRTKATRSFSAQLHRTARRKLLYLHDAADLRDLRTPPGNRLEKLKGEWEDFYSIRINVSGDWSSDGATDRRMKYGLPTTTDRGKVKTIERQPKNPFHLGEMLLEEFLEPMGMALTAFAEKIGWSQTQLNAFIRGERDVTADAALDLEEVLGTSAKLWMNMQSTYDLDRAIKARSLVVLGT